MERCCLRAYARQSQVHGSQSKERIRASLKKDVEKRTVDDAGARGDLDGKGWTGRSGHAGSG